jgi:hypothetical protein
MIQNWTMKWVAVAAIAAAITLPAAGVTVTVRADQGKPISPDLFGIFFEDINYAADGGLYAELVQNRSFEYTAADHNGLERADGLGTGHARRRPGRGGKVETADAAQRRKSALRGRDRGGFGRRAAWDLMNSAASTGFRSKAGEQV